MEKQRIRVGSVGWIIERFIREMNGLDTGKPVKPLGLSHLYTLRTLQRAPIGAVRASALTKHQVIDHCKERGKIVKPATVAHDVGYLSGVLKYAPSAWDDCEEVSNAPVLLALPFLAKHEYIGKSIPRKRVPTDDEITLLLNYFSVPPKKDRQNIIKMPDMIAFALVSTRRISEICRITHGDIDWQRKMYWVRNLKHPRFKAGNHKEFAMLDPIPEIIARQPRLRPDDPNERVFPYNAKSVGAKYTLAKKALGIVNLRFHDNRREAITRWLKFLPPHKVKMISGHETTFILERVYDAQKPEGLHAELEAILGKDPKPANHEPTWHGDHN